MRHHLLLLTSYLLLITSLPAFAQKASKGSLRDSAQIVTNETDTAALAALAAATNDLYAAVTNDRLYRAQGDAAERAYTVTATNDLWQAAFARVTAATNAIGILHADRHAALAVLLTQATNTEAQARIAADYATLTNAQAHVTAAAAAAAAALAAGTNALWQASLARLTAATNGITFSEADTLRTVYARGNFNGTETISPASVSIGGTVLSMNGMVISDEPLNTTTVRLTDDGLSINTEEYQWQIIGPTLDFNLLAAGLGPTSWSFFRTNGTYAAAAVSDIEIHSTSPAAHANKLNATGGTATNLQIRGTLTWNGNAVLTNASPSTPIYIGVATATNLTVSAGTYYIDLTEWPATGMTWAAGIEWASAPDMTMTGRYEFAFATWGTKLQGRQIYPTYCRSTSLTPFAAVNTASLGALVSSTTFSTGITNYIATLAGDPLGHSLVTLYFGAHSSTGTLMRFLTGWGYGSGSQPSPATLVDTGSSILLGSGIYAKSFIVPPSGLAQGRLVPLFIYGIKEVAEGTIPVVGLRCSSLDELRINWYNAGGRL